MSLCDSAPIDIAIDTLKAILAAGSDLVTDDQCITAVCMLFNFLTTATKQSKETAVELLNHIDFLYEHLDSPFKVLAVPVDPVRSRHV